MAVIDDHVRILFLIRNDPQSAYTTSDNLLEEDGASQIAMSQQSKSKEGIGHPFRKENSSDLSWDVCKGISHTSNDDVLEKSGIVAEGRALLRFEDVSFSNELEGQSQDYSIQQWLPSSSPETAHPKMAGLYQQVVGMRICRLDRVVEELGKSQIQRSL